MKKRAISLWLIAVFLLLECLLYAIFLSLDLAGRGWQTIELKYAGILLCFLFALLCAFRGGDKLVAPALALTAVADWFLLVRNDHLALGVAVFLCVQTIYLIRLRLLGVPQFPWIRAGLALLMGLVLYRLQMATPLNLLAALYFSQLLSNTILSWTCPNKLFAVGLTLFVGCDVCVGLFNCGLLLPLTSIGMWLFYLPSQVLIVLSSLPKEVPHENQ